IKYAPDSLAKDGNFVGFLCKKLTNENITSEERRKFVRNMQPAFLSNEKVMSAVLGRDDQSGRSCWDAVSGSVFENLFYLGNIYDLKGRSNKDTSINTGSGNGFVKTSDGVGFYFKDIGAKSTECNVEVCGLLQYEALHESLSQEESDIPSNNGEPSFSFVKNAREIIKESKDIDRFYEVIHRYDTINITSDSWGNYDALKLVKKALGEGKKVEWTIGSVANERFLYPSSYCLGRSFTKQLEGLFADKSYNKEKLSVAVSGEHKYNFFHPSKDMDVVPKLVEKFNLREEEPSANPLNPNSNGKKKPDNRQC
ncbi:hypothetical protein N8772_04710, partial [Rickettsiales bacterium]|nr:hypothetical protein [Rickettsiales bacterium]